MRVYLHIPPHRLGEKFFDEREVPIDLPFAPFPGLVIGVCIGDGSSEAPGQGGKVRVVTVEVNHSWTMGREPMPSEDSAPFTEIFTEWVRRPGYRGRRG